MDEPKIDLDNLPPGWKAQWYYEYLCRPIRDWITERKWWPVDDQKRAHHSAKYGQGATGRVKVSLERINRIEDD